MLNNEISADIFADDNARALYKLSWTRNLAYIYKRQNKIDEAFAYFKESFAIASTRQQKAALVPDLVEVCFAKKNYSEIWRCVGDKTIIDCGGDPARVWRIIGIMYQEGLSVMANQEEAYNSFKKVFKYYDDIERMRDFTRLEVLGREELRERLGECASALYTPASQKFVFSEPKDGSSNDDQFFNDAYFQSDDRAAASTSEGMGLLSMSLGGESEALPEVFGGQFLLADDGLSDELAFLDNTAGSGSGSGSAGSRASLKRKEHPAADGDDGMEQGPAQRRRLDGPAFAPVAQPAAQSALQAIAELAEAELD